MDYLLQVVGEIVLFGGGATALTLALVRWFGKKWFEHQFNERLEKFKRQQNELLEQTRYEINKRFDRVTKVHEKEFEVLPEAWQLLQDAYGNLNSVASPLQQWPDLDRYSEKQLETFLEKSELHEFQKAELREADDKLQYYQNKVYWMRMSGATKSVREFRNYLTKNKIFLSKDLSGLFSDIESVMIRAQVELETPPDEPWRDSFNTFKKLNDQMKQLLEQLEEAVQERLHFEQ